MKIYVVVSIFHPQNEPNNYTVSCEAFKNISDAEKYKELHETEYPKIWIGDHNQIEIFEKEI